MIASLLQHVNYWYVLFYIYLTPFARIKTRMPLGAFYESAGRCVEEIQAESKKALKAIPAIEFNKCFDDWKKRRHKCIISGGDYFEGDEIDFDK